MPTWPLSTPTPPKSTLCVPPAGDLPTVYWNGLPVNHRYIKYVPHVIPCVTYFTWPATWQRWHFQFHVYPTASRQHQQHGWCGQADTSCHLTLARRFIPSITLSCSSTWTVVSASQALYTPGYSPVCLVGLSLWELAPIHLLLLHLQLPSPKAPSLGRYYSLSTPHLFPPLLGLIMSANSNMQMTRNSSWPCLLLTTVKVLMYFNLA